MSRYVDISELEIPEDDCCYADLEAFVETVCESEYIDLVTCGECKYWRNKDPERIPTASIMCGHMHPDDFCSYGERKGE